MDLGHDIPICDRLAYYSITPEDSRHLLEVRQMVVPHLKDILTGFYRHVGQDRQGAAIFSDLDLQQRAEAAQFRHWQERVFSGAFDEAYFHAVTRIGVAHMRAGVDLRLFVGGYGFILRKFTELILERFETEPARLHAMLSAVQKAVFLDMEIASSAYTEQSTLLLKEMSLTDPLTNIPNRRALEEWGLKAFAQARRHARPLSIAILDLDRFKLVNDTYGHAAGDDVLRGTAECLRANLRLSDGFGRWGGEEFLIILPGARYQAAIGSLRRLLDVIGQTSFQKEDETFEVTASIGLAELSAADVSFEHLVNRADAALYKAKEVGRDRVFAA